MNRTVTKLLAAAMALVISAVLIVTITYAWTTLSVAPVAEGIQIAIGGGHTILLAPDQTEEVDGTLYHYPGAFQDTLTFSRYRQYDYLKEVDTLSPVSTADGLNWFLPEFYGISDEAVQNGDASVGETKPVSEFRRDEELKYANLTQREPEDGHYIFLDFWVVSPGTSYTLRVARGDENGGSYLIELPSVGKNENGFFLEETKGNFAASARVGFLVNTDYVADQAVTYYQRSPGSQDRFATLAGNYQEKGNPIFHGSYRFTVYEPNGDLHPQGITGSYIPTQPVGLSGSVPAATEIWDRLTVQLNNRWKQKTDGAPTLSELLTVALVGKNNQSADQAETALYDTYLQGQVAPYVAKGDFLSRMTDLRERYADDGQVTVGEMELLEKAGATKDTYIVELEKNVPQRIRMFVWIEGQDADCTELIEAQRFALSLELAGSNQK